MERPRSVPPEPQPASDQRRLVLAGLDGLDRVALESLLPSALGATGAVLVERAEVEGALEEVGRGREAGALTAVLVGARAGERELVRLARGLGNRSGPIPVVVLLSAALSEQVELALSEGCSDVLVRGRANADDLVRALRCSFEIARRERAEERLRMRLLEPTAPAGLLAEARHLVGLGRTLSATGHDLNNLLQPVLGYSELLLGTLEPDTRAAYYAQQIERSAQLAAALVNRILASSRHGGPAAAPVEADERLRGSEDLVRWALGPERELKVSTGASGMKVRLRDGALEQVLLNLSANARDALPPGGRLTLRTRSEGAETWRLEVEDTGNGIPADSLGRVLEAGFTTKPAGKGSGLGLWIVRGLIEEAGGTLTLESLEGQGTTVTVRLPAAGSRPARPAD
jgi:signal transduction histidine kinase